MHVLATAGHVDHGKSTLVKALTGIDPDRLVEERERGLTIDLGFAWTELPSGAEIAFVDVPGHVRFIKNMLAGVGAVDACLFVVAATEGWKPQSEEHLRILELLGAARGLVALTKVAGLDDEWRELARLDVSDHLTGSFLAESEIVEIDAPAGVGVDALREALDRLVVATPTAVDKGRPRLWVDRSFSARGSGTVVTGTLTGGSLQEGEELLVVGPNVRRPKKVRIRALQSHNEARERMNPGRRVAVNLTGLAHERPYRGDALVRPGQWFLSRKLDCSLGVLGALDHDVGRRGAYQAYIGSGEHPVGVRVLGAQALAPGSTGHVRLHLPVALPLLPGDRYVLRESGRSETVGGGEIIDVDPVLPASKAAPSRSASRVVAERGWVDADILELLTGERCPPNMAGRWVVDPAALAEAAGSVGALIAGAGPLGLDLATLDDRQRAVAASLEGVVIEDGRARTVSSGGAHEALTGHRFLAALRESPFSPPDPQGQIERVELRALVRMGLVVERDGCCFAAEAVDEAARVVAGLLQAQPEGVTVATIRDRLGTTRKYILPLLAHLDANGVTRRRGALRVAGPRAPSAAAGGGDGAPPGAAKPPADY